MIKFINFFISLSAEIKNIIIIIIISITNTGCLDHLYPRHGSCYWIHTQGSSWPLNVKHASLDILHLINMYIFIFACIDLFVLS